MSRHRVPDHLKQRNQETFRLSDKEKEIFGYVHNHIASQKHTSYSRSDYCKEIIMTAVFKEHAALVEAFDSQQAAEHAVEVPSSMPTVVLDHTSSYPSSVAQISVKRAQNAAKKVSAKRTPAQKAKPKKVSANVNATNTKKRRRAA